MEGALGVIDAAANAAAVKDAGMCLLASPEMFFLF